MNYRHDDRSKENKATTFVYNPIVVNSGQFLIDSSFVIVHFVLLCHMTRFLCVCTCGFC